eukprot:tig00001428_g8731.t1
MNSYRRSAPSSAFVSPLPSSPSACSRSRQASFAAAVSPAADGRLASKLSPPLRHRSGRSVPPCFITNSGGAEPEENDSEDDDDSGDEEASSVPAPLVRPSKFDNIAPADNLDVGGSSGPTLYGLSEICLFPLSVVLFPGTVMPLHIFEDRYKLMFKDILDADKLFGVVLYSEDEGRGTLATVGCCAEVTQTEKLEDGQLIVITHAKKRFRIVQITQQKPYVKAIVQWLDDVPPAAAEGFESLEGRRAEVAGALRDVLELSGKLSGTAPEKSLQVLDSWCERAVAEGPSSPLYEEFSFAVAGTLDMELAELQLLLEMQETLKRLEVLLSVMKGTRDYLAAQVALKNAFSAAN